MDISPLWISLRVALLATFITFFAGIYAARIVVNLRRFRGLLDGIFTLPLVLPPTVVGFFLLLLFGKNGFLGKILSVLEISVVFSWVGAVVASTVVSFPLMYRTVRGAFEQIDQNLIYAARTIGMSEGTIFWKIIVPLAWPSIAAGGILAFARALGEFGATIMLAGNIPGKTRTMSVAVYAAVQAGDRALAYRWVLIIMLISFTAMILMNYWANYQNRLAKKWGIRVLKVEIRKKLSNFTLEVAFTAEQETLAILGPSGCGKSMTLKCIAGVETPDEGYIELNGRVLFDKSKKINLPPQKRRVGYLFQNYALFPHLTVEENIAVAVQGDKQTKGKVVEEKIKAFYLEGLEKAYPAKLSGGQQQRVALARLMAQNPEILLLDEPFSALDNYLRWQLEQEIAELLKLYQKPALLVSHNFKEVYRLCDRVAVLCAGQVEVIAPKQELFELPQTVTAARLIGYKNISRIKRLDGRRALALDWGVELELKRQIPESAGYIGFMATNIRLAEAGSPNLLRCRILRVVENTFSTMVILQPRQASALEEYNKIIWEMDKEEWQVLQGEHEFLTIAIDADKLLPLK